MLKGTWYKIHTADMESAKRQEKAFLKGMFHSCIIIGYNIDYLDNDTVLFLIAMFHRNTWFWFDSVSCNQIILCTQLAESVMFQPKKSYFDMKRQFYCWNLLDNKRILCHLTLLIFLNTFKNKWFCFAFYWTKSCS